MKFLPVFFQTDSMKLVQEEALVGLFMLRLTWSFIFLK
jgi:hypothetical protein